ncbi:hypothetical protein PAALTS15_05993 [Paenibacillus alvei TS-15]|jgi:uncharacterized membrane protein|uniref:ECF transporter S component n=1 Tax=Paenibacillus alvei TS-15 TaxID=1117108 RepID=S9SU91_PAEAL|nr:ECF transporter S component [Paenibacillus alvei]EPY08254.1 hypothetical protein PAALTS15_05993 [Paenibacillus alvei TS-15]
MNSNPGIRKIVIAGVLGSIAILLGITQLGFIPVPTAAGTVTIVHIPVIVGAILEGRGVGTAIGLIFGVTSLLESTIPLFKDPLVAIVPRLFIGLFAYLIYAALKRKNEYIAIGAAGFIGSITNTVLVLTAAVLRNYLSLEVAVSVGLTNGIPEAIVSVIITTAVVAGWKKLTPNRKQKAKLLSEEVKG